LKVKTVAVLALAVGQLLVSGPASAHHGNASTFEGKTISAKGTVVEWVWSNPHCLLRIDETTESGEVRHWIVETQAPANMIDAGWSKNSFKPGDQVTIELRPAKTGKPVGSLSKVTFADGRVLSTERQTGIGADLYKK
jgi:Family of unknown function (DUF6152)